MQEKDLISVIVPVYNVEPYLSECVNSILNQTYKNFEVILVDDGSSDGSGELCDKYAETYTFIKVIHQENQGPSAARNIGVDKSKGEYICFIDSDDIVSEDYLITLYNNIKLFNADVSICSFIRFDNEEGFLSNVENIPIKIGKEEFIEGIMRFRFRSEAFTVAVWNKIIRRSIAERISFPVGKWHEDNFYTNRLILEADSFVFTPSVLYYYRQRSDSIMGRLDKSDPRHIVAIEAIFKERLQICKQICSKKTYMRILMHQSMYKMKIKLRYVARRIDLFKNNCFLKK